MPSPACQAALHITARLCYILFYSTDDSRALPGLACRAATPALEGGEGLRHVGCGCMSVGEGASMRVIPTMLGMVAGVCLYVGVLHVLVGRRRAEKGAHLTFG